MITTGKAPVLAIDGPGGSGKGTVGQILAQRFGWHFLDSGALYRAVGVVAKREKISFDDPPALAHLATIMEIRFIPQTDGSAATVLMNGQDIGDQLRTEESGKLASIVAPLPEVRRALGYPRDAFEWGNARHRGDLWRAILRAWDGRQRVRGASTITQQLAKNLYLSPSRNPLRKVKESLLAKRLEWLLPKDRILELYLNVVEFGPGIWGVEAASQAYFNKPAARLSRAEAAALAAVLPFPLLSNPASRPARMRARQAMILRRLE